MPRRTVTRAELDRPLTPYQEALKTVLATTPQPRPRRLRLEEAAGCVVSEAIRSPRDVPGFANSAMDGYAVRASELAAARPARPVRLQIADSVLAGHRRPSPLPEASCVEIGTGAPIPPGADAVVPFEVVRKAGRWVEFDEPARPGDHIRPVDDVVARGRLLVRKGERLTPVRAGSLAQCGVAMVPAYPPPRVAIISTGDEIIPPGTPYKRGAVYDANTYLLSSLCGATGCRVVATLRCPDRKEALGEAIRQAAGMSDLVIASGGASVGPHDWAKTVAGKLVVWRVALKPGKPFGYARGPRGTPVMLLPGNPGSALAAFAAFGFDVLARLSGERPPKRLSVSLAEPVIPDSRRILLVPVSLAGSRGGFSHPGSRLEAVPLPTRSSAALQQYSDADGIAFVSPGRGPRRSAKVLTFPWHNR